MDDHRRLQSTVVGAPEVRVRTVSEHGRLRLRTCPGLRRGSKESASQASEADELTKTGMRVAGRVSTGMRATCARVVWMDGWMIQIRVRNGRLLSENKSDAMG